MPENPLLPHRKLRELHALMLICRKLVRRQKHAPEALLAATAIHLLPGDLICSTDPLHSEIAPSNKAGLVNAGIAAISPVLPTAAALARGQQATSSDAATAALTLAFVTAGKPEPGWQAALTWAQQAQLPLLLAATDTTGVKQRPAKNTAAFTWAAVSSFAKKLNIPILVVDGEDAVAVYRCMQEAVIRARYGGGPAIIWAILTPPSDTPLPRAQQPLIRLQKYLTVRNISLTGK